MKLSKLPTGEPEIFYTIQGEGVSMGKPALFMRLSLCNLHCSWCDTPYTWNWEDTPWQTTEGKKYSKADQIITLSVEELLPKLQSYPCTHLVITGGEPLIQQKELAQLISALPSAWTFEVETNGTIIPDAFPSRASIQYNVSPKLSHSGNPRNLALNPESLMWLRMQKHAYFKFVISQPSDLTEVQAIQREHNIPASQIILMPKGTNSSTIQSEALNIVNLCLEHGYRYSDRLHVHLWGNERAK